MGVVVSHRLSRLVRSRARGELPALGRGWLIPGAALAAAFAIFVAIGQIDTGEPLGVVAIATTCLAAALALVLLRPSGSGRRPAPAAWQVIHLLGLAAIALVAAADTGGEGASAVSLLGIGVIAAAALRFAPAYVAVLTAAATLGVFAAEALGEAAGHPTDYGLTTAMALVVAAAGSAFALAASRPDGGQASAASTPATGRLSASRLEAVARYSPAAILVFDAAGMPAYASPAIEQLLGSPVTWPPGARGEGAPDLGRVVREAARGRPQRLEFTVEDPAGRVRIVDGVFFPLDTGAGLVAIDITEVRELTLQLSQAQRMETLGVIAGGLTHDFNNLLTVVLGNLYVVRMTVGDSDDARVVIEETTRACERAAEVVRKLMDYARPRPAAREAVSVGGVLAETELLARGLLPATVSLVVESPADDLVVSADPSALQQVLLNLVVNARDAVAGGGRVRLSAARADVGADSPLLEAGLLPGGYATVVVEDTGTGMESATLARVFDPFFTTKGAGRGTGLGLATAQGIARGYDGLIVAESEPGHGSTFRVYLPLQESAIPV